MAALYSRAIEMMIPQSKVTGIVNYVCNRHVSLIPSDPPQSLTPSTERPSFEIHVLLDVEQDPALFCEWFMAVVSGVDVFKIHPYHVVFGSHSGFKSRIGQPIDIGQMDITYEQFFEGWLKAKSKAALDDVHMLVRSALSTLGLDTTCFASPRT
jgi:hypothetical protein